MEGALLITDSWNLTLCREYMAARAARWRERDAFRKMSRRRYPSLAVRYPMELHDLPRFATWLTERVSRQRQAGLEVDDDVLQYAQPPERYAIAHKKMYAFGMHFRVRGAEGGLVTRDSCVVASFIRQIPWGLRNGQPIETTEEYVGYIEEILELDYRNHCTTVLVCDWVRPSQDARHPNITRDQYGFTVANFNRMDGKVHSNSFAFPLHCQQVYFSNDPTRPGWKIVCRTDVRGRRGQLHVNQCVPNIIDVRHDAEFVGLQPQMQEVEPTREPATDGGMHIQVTHGDRGQEDDEAPY